MTYMYICAVPQGQGQRLQPRTKLAARSRVTIVERTDDLTHNRGFMAVGSSGDTAAFAVNAITAWWDGPGSQAFPMADQLLILADGGGSNSWQGRRWKLQVQEQLCDRRGLTVTICHYPTGCSKWNPSSIVSLGPSASTGRPSPCGPSTPCWPPCVAPPPAPA
jgi:hypothetical protein